MPLTNPPEPRGYPGNLGSLFAAHASSRKAALIDLRDAAAPRALSYRELDAACDAVARDSSCVYFPWITEVNPSRA